MSDQEDLSRQFSPSAWSHRMGPEEVLQAYFSTTERRSHVARSEGDRELDVSYGLTAKTKLDIFGGRTLPRDAPLFVYFHGGYWRAGEREGSSFMAKPFTEAGAVVVVVGYDLAPAATMETIVEEAKEATAHVLALARERNSRGVYLCGHSAGAHLVAMTLAADWTKSPTGGLIKGAFLISGIYDLRRLVHTAVNAPLSLTEAAAWTYSPLRLQRQIAAQNPAGQLLVAVAQHDSPEFKRQSHEFSAALRSHGTDANFVEIPDTDHFDVIEKLSDEGYTLAKDCMRTMGLS